MNIKDFIDKLNTLCEEAEFPTSNTFIVEIDREFSESRNLADYLSLWGQKWDGSYPICGNDIILKIKQD